jgi:hypothetical protein
MPLSSPSRFRSKTTRAAAFVLVGMGSLVWFWRHETVGVKSFMENTPAPIGESAPARETSGTLTTTGYVSTDSKSFGFLAGLFSWSGTKSDQSAIDVPPPVIPNPMSPEEAQMFPRQAEPGSFFPDVPSDHWVSPVLMDLTNRKLVKGFPDGTFRPGQPMSRAEFATQLASVFDFPHGDLTATFQDVPLDNWAYKNIQTAILMGFLTGYPEGKFVPDEPVTRLQVIAALTNGLNLKSSSGTAPVLKNYKDRQNIPAWGQRPVVAATEARMIINYPNIDKLRPNDLASRAEVIAMLHRALVYTGDVEDIQSPYLVLPHQMPY